MDDPDVMALKFLRARKWQVTAGVAMMCACMRWRMTSDVESIFKKGEEGMKDAEGFLMQMVCSAQVGYYLCLANVLYFYY